MRRCLFVILVSVNSLLFAQVREASDLIPVFVAPYASGESELPLRTAGEIGRAVEERLEASGYFRILTDAASRDGVGESYILSIGYLSHTITSSASGPALRLVSQVELTGPDGERGISDFTLPTIGFGPTPDDAWNSAAAAISDQILVELERRTPFILTGGVAAVNGTELLIDFGDEMGLYPGMELLLARTGKGIEDIPPGAETGLVRVREVRGNIAFAELLYGSASTADRLIDPGWAGYQSALYGRVLLSPGGESVPIAGTYTERRRSFRSFRPRIGLEVPMEKSVTGERYLLFPYIGLGTALDWGRFQLTPSGSVGIGIAPLSVPGAAVTHYGGMADLRLSYLTRREWRIALGAGYAYWTGTKEIDESLKYAYNGVMLEFGILRTW